MNDKRIYNLADRNDFEAFAATYGRATAKAFRKLDSRFVYDELAPMRWVDTEYYGGVPWHVNPKPYYSWTMCRRSLNIVQLAVKATEGEYRAVECFNHAVDGGIVFG